MVVFLFRKHLYHKTIKPIILSVEYISYKQISIPAAYNSAVASKDTLIIHATSARPDNLYLAMQPNIVSKR